MKTSSREPNAASRQTHMSMWPCDMAAQTRVLLSLIQTVLRCVVWVFTSLCSRGQLCQTLSLSHQNHLFYSICTPLIIYRFTFVLYLQCFRCQMQQVRKTLLCTRWYLQCFVKHASKTYSIGNNGIVFHSVASSIQSWEANKTDWRYCDSRN